MTCEKCPMTARVARLERSFERLHEARSDALVPVLRREMGDEWVTAGELWRLAEAQEDQAAATGEPPPELVEALEDTGIHSAHGLGRWLAAREGQGFIRGEIVKGGVLWRRDP